MAKSPLRTVLDLTKLSDEDRAKLEINQQKSVKSGTGFASTLQIRDSVETRTTEEVVTEEQPVVEEVVTEEQRTSVSGEVVETELETQPAFDPAVLQSLIEQAVTRNIEPLQAQATASQARVAELEAQLQTANTQIEESRAAQSAVDSLSQLLGRTATPVPATTVEMPNVNTRTSPSSDALTGLLGEYMQERSGSDVRYRTTKKGGLVPIYDTSRVDRFAIENGWNRKTSKGYKTLMRELTEMGKKNGLFRGSASLTEAEVRAATTGGNIPAGFLDTLSSIMRVSARPGLVFWQFANTIHRFDRGLGERVDVPRARYPEVVTDSNQRLLSGSGTYVPIDSSNAPVQTGFTQLQLQEYGRGRAEAPPIAIPTFVETYSMISLMPILERDLFYDFYNWEDLIIREQWKPTTQVFYNNGNALVSTASAVATGGKLTREFLGQLFVWFANNRVVPLPDGNYGLVISPTALNQLKQDLSEFWSPVTPEQIEELTNMMLLNYPNGEDLQISGYQGCYEGFHIWVTNAFAVGAAGTEGVTSETNGASGTSIFREGYAFGGATAARGIGGTGTQILYDEKTDFGRMQRAIWHTYEAHAPMDVDPTGYNDTSLVPQELRVVKVRTADVAVA